MTYDLPSSSDVSAYLMRFNCQALYVLTAPEQTGPPVIVGCATDLRRAIGNVVRSCPGFAHVDLAWCGWTTADHAKRIANAVSHTTRHYAALPIDVATAVATIEQVASRYGVTLKPHAAVMASVTASIGRLAERIESARSSGAMSGPGGFNRMYRQYRLQRQRDQKSAMPYTVAMKRLNRVMAEAAASGGASSQVALFSKVFGSD